MALPATLHHLPLRPGGLAWHAGAPGRLQRAGRAWPALALAAAVLGGHAWLASLLAADLPRAGAPRAAAVQLRSLPQAARQQQPQPQLQPGPQPAQAVAGPRATPVPRPVTAPVQPPPVLQRRPADAAAAGPAGELAPAPLPSPTPSPSPVALPVADAAGTSPGTLADGEPPPLYPTRLPPPVQLRYALQYNGRSGEAVLTWQHDGSRYQLTLDGSTASGQPLVAQASAGAIDAHGLAPERYTDRRSAGRLRAANFRRDAGHIGYSGAPQQHPAWPGAQDRLSWVAQLAAILAAAQDQPAALRMFVVDALGNAGLWQFQRQPDVLGPSPWGEVPQQHWLRMPPRPEGLRIELWLAAADAPNDAPTGASGGAPAGHWPLRLRFEAPRSGDVFALQLVGAP